MKIVIISAVMFPRTSPRAVRTTELAKYFASKGHDVTLYGCAGNYNYDDFQRQTGVKVRNIEKRRFSRLESDGSYQDGLFDKICKRLFGKYLEWPNIELSWKVNSILKQDYDADLLITIAIPHPIHWGAAWRKKHANGKFPKVWVSDCGDPYCGNSVDANSHPSYFKKIEKFWGDQTDYVAIPIEEGRKAYFSNVQDKIRVIPQGIDFSQYRIERYTKNDVPSFAFAGATYEGYRDPSEFLEYLSTLDFDFRFYVFTPPASIFHKYKERLGEKIVISNYIPREDLIPFLSKMDFLVNIANNSSVQSPSKLMDYGLTKRPILTIATRFEQSKNFEAFVRGDYSLQEVVDIERFNINRVGQQFIDLVCGKA